MVEPDPDWREAAGQGRAPAPAGKAMPRLSVAGFEGPLDFLLEMIRPHRMDLGPLSIVALTDQLVAALEDSAHRVHSSAAAPGWSQPVTSILLKAWLLCPESPAVAKAAAAEATRRLGKLTELARLRAAADWLSARLQLGLRVFARGQMEWQARPSHETDAELIGVLPVRRRKRLAKLDCNRPSCCANSHSVWRCATSPCLAASSQITGSASEVSRR